jgi:hypothetical protein
MSKETPEIELPNEKPFQRGLRIQGDVLKGTVTAEDRQRMTDRLKSIIGQWPGDETDEQVEQALRELS